MQKCKMQKKISKRMPDINLYKLLYICSHNLTTQLT
jgi:hypothetical protein